MKIKGSPVSKNSNPVLIGEEPDWDLDFSEDTQQFFITPERIHSALVYGGNDFLGRVIQDSTDRDIVEVAKEAAETGLWRVLEFLLTHRLAAIQNSPEYEQIKVRVFESEKKEVFYHLMR